MYTRLYWVIIPIMDLIQAIDTARRVMTNKKLDGQVTGQASATPFMTLEDGKSNSRPHSSHHPYSHGQITFDRYGELYQKIDELSDMISKMATSNTSSQSNKPYKPYIYQRRRKGEGNKYRGSQPFRYRSYTRDIYNDRLLYR